MMLYGLGDTPATGTMVNGTYVMSTPITTDTVSSSGQNVFTNSAGNVIATDSSLTSWLGNNTTLVIGLAVGAAVLLMFAKAGR